MYSHVLLTVPKVGALLVCNQTLFSLERVFQSGSSSFFSRYVWQVGVTHCTRQTHSMPHCPLATISFVAHHVGIGICVCVLHHILLSTLHKVPFECSAAALSVAFIRLPSWLPSVFIVGLWVTLISIRCNCLCSIQPLRHMHCSTS